MKQSRKIVALEGALAVLLSSSGVILLAASQAAPAEDGYIRRGRELYARHCAACHGRSGRGDGPAAPSLKSAPADLTSITQKYGSFSMDQVMVSIDGEKASTAHGTSEMPIWGRKFRREKGEAGALGDVYALARFIRSIQNRPSARP
jgi:mono/diheme cytochrome c family protein